MSKGLKIHEHILKITSIILFKFPKNKKYSLFEKFRDDWVDENGCNYFFN